MAVTVASRMTRKYQVTIPAEVRRALRLEKGDVVQFEVVGDRVTLRRQTAADRAYLKGLQKSLVEWDSPFDAEAYGDLGRLAPRGRAAVSRPLATAIAR